MEAYNFAFHSLIFRSQKSNACDIAALVKRDKVKFCDLLHGFQSALVDRRHEFFVSVALGLAVPGDNLAAKRD